MRSSSTLEPDSCLRVRVVPTSDILRIEWDAVPGRRYFLQVALDDATAFSDLPEPSFPRVASGTLEAYEQTGPLLGFPARYYRVRVAP